MINKPPAADSNYVVPQRVTLRLDYERAFFGDAMTRITLFGYWNEGQAQSYGMAGSECPFEDDSDNCFTADPLAGGEPVIGLEGDGFFGRHLLYVPTGPNDPNVVFDPGFDQAEFFAWVAREGLSPGFTQRNQRNADWSTRFDLRVSQDIPLPGDLRGRLYLKVYNLGNLLNDDWGKITDSVFFTPEIVESAIIESTGQFYYNDFSDRSIERTIRQRSLWEARIGLDIRFGG